ncbi:P-loop NTPase fold protein [Micromonospora sp. NPDC047557]|uniref:P-loop NTPase fold protein n=1 Tax=Micromonospora sp. NPDC047557 TaxID=3364250 RepID=UPI003711578B
MGSGRFSWLLGAGPLFFAALFAWAFAAAYSTPAAVSLGVLLSAAAVLVAGTIAARATADDVERFLERIRSRLERNVSGFLRSRYLYTAELEGGMPDFQRLRASYPDFWPQALRTATEPPIDLFNALSDRRRDGVLGLIRFALAAGVLLALLCGVVISLAEPAARLGRALYRGAVVPSDVTRRWTAAVRATELPQLDFYLLLGCLVIAVVALARATPRRLESWIVPAEQWSTAGDAMIQHRLRAAFEEHADNPGQAPVLPRMPISPTLADVSADRLVDRSEIEQIRALVFFLGAQAVAISGSRGVGKTTMLRSLTEESPHPDTFGLMISAPVRYEPRDFMLHLYAQLCEAVVRRLGRQRPPTLWRRGSRTLRRLAITLLSLVTVTCVLALAFPGTRRLVADGRPLPQLAGTYLVFGVACFLIARRLRAGGQTSEAHLSAEATRRLRQIRFLQTLSVEHSGQAAPLSIQFGWKWGRQWAEQPLSLPDVVAAYREFTTQVAAWWRDETDDRGKLVIAIDELDRIAEPELAERFLNEIKAIFGVKHCAYLVSVSEEALVNFERRVVRTRTVFDSAFDQVVHLRPMLMSDSVALLRHRLSGVPSCFWMLCHCLAGGMPRDVLRVARMMFELHRRSTVGNELDAVAAQLVALEVQAVKRGFQQRLARDVAEGGDPKLAKVMYDPHWPDITICGLRTAADEWLAGPEPTDAGTALAAALLYYSVVLEVFRRDSQIVADWRHSDLGVVRRTPLDEDPLAVDLARAHQQLAVDPPTALQQLRHVQGHLKAG